MAPVSLCLILKKKFSSPIALAKPAILTLLYSMAHLEKVCPISDVALSLSSPRCLCRIQGRLACDSEIHFSCCETNAPGSSWKG